MGTREQLIVIYSKKGWDNLVATIGSNLLSQHERKTALDLINGSDSHQTTPQGDHLLFFSGIDTAHPDTQILVSTVNDQTSCPSTEWMIYTIYDDGTEDSWGRYYNNPFAPSVQRNLTWVDSNTIRGALLNIATPPPPKPAAMIIKDDHTCTVCGNTKCSKHETSCWRCGTPI